MKAIRLHTHGNTWKYTLDVFSLRVVFWRVKKVNALGHRVKLIDINI